GYFCFFFQAEDGIRDLTVTGVQTCALPISSWLTGRTWLLLHIRHRLLFWILLRNRNRDTQVWCCSVDLFQDGFVEEKVIILVWRSEERRVGKECSCRW